jgi:Holliday junction DNA helicase RuvA
MIVTIRGKLLKKTPSEAIIDVNGLGYQCHISVNTYESLGGPGDEISLLTHYHVTENSQNLFAFHNETERELFEMLISVSGIGPKTGISLLSAVTPDEFKRRLIAGEVAMLTALPGIGPKTARRIIVELKDKFVKLAEDELPKEEEDLLPAAGDAYDALMALGFPAKDVRASIQSIIKADEYITTEDLIKSALADMR